MSEGIQPQSATFTVNGGTYGAAVVDGKYYIFDSHGLVTSSPDVRGHAFIETFSSAADAAQFLATRMIVPKTLEQITEQISVNDVAKGHIYAEVLRLARSLPTPRRT